MQKSAVGTVDHAEVLRERIRELAPTGRVDRLRELTLNETRRMSVEQALIITRSYREHEGEPRMLQRAFALKQAFEDITIRIDPGELIVGNRTPGVRAGVVSPEAGIGWVAAELDTLPTREQDPFDVDPETARAFLEEIVPEWTGRTLEDIVRERHGDEIAAVKKVVKINQTDHAQGHICPDVAAWLRLGPAGIQERIQSLRAKKAAGGSSMASSAAAEIDTFYDAAELTMTGMRTFMRRYADLAKEQAAGADDTGAAGAGAEIPDADHLAEIARICNALADRPPESFREALQSIWFLFVGLQLESNASSFSPGRFDQYTYPFLERDLANGVITLSAAQELLDSLWIKFNQIVYMRNASSAEYFAGFPIGFNIAVGGMDRSGADATNLLSFMCLKAQENIGLPQPNLSARLWPGSPHAFVDECARIIGLGSGMPQIVSDESIIPSLMSRGIPSEDARDYAVVGCVELSTQGNDLGWSDAAMFNVVKALELALNDGVCLQTGERLGPSCGTIEDHDTMEDVDGAIRVQIDHFMDRMIPLCDSVDRLHAEVLPSPFLSCVIDECLDKGTDVTAGGARYNLSGIQAIQVANVADSLAALKDLAYDRGTVTRTELLAALRTDFNDSEALRQKLMRAPKYGNDIEWVDELGAKWARHFADRLTEFTNARGGPYHMGLYTVSAHVPMGKNVGATPDGRRSAEPLADGGMSAVYGRDISGPTALLNSVSRVGSLQASNGTLLNMKFLPRTFRNNEERGKFVTLLRAFLTLGIHHVQFNVVDHRTLIAAQKDPEGYRNLTIRVAGYTAYFVELAPDLQDEIIERTAYEF